MELLVLLINVGAAATLLLWAVRMVRTGFERANGNAFRRAIQHSNSNRFKAAGVGLVVSVLLQSSTAVAVLAAGFAASGVIGFIPGMALLLGADLGSALVVQILSIDLSWLMPILLLTGGVLFLKGKTGLIRQIGRIVLGIGMILLSLKLIGEATAPLRESSFLLLVMGISGKRSSRLVSCRRLRYLVITLKRCVYSTDSGTGRAAGYPFGSRCCAGFRQQHGRGAHCLWLNS